MLKKILLYTIVVLTLFTTVACSSDDESEDYVEPCSQTVVMFYPWSSTLLGDFMRNVRDFSSVIARRGLHGERVLVCMSTSKNEAVLFELKASKGRCIADTLRHYSNRSFTTRLSMANLFSEIKETAPARKYGMVVGCHGLSWVTIDRTGNANKMRRHYDIASPLHTRYLGGLTTDTQIETVDFAGALSDAGMKMEYILFDNCYMSSVEVAYELKDVTDYIIASPTEIMSYGFPYSKCGDYLLGDVDYKNIAETFVEYYANSTTPYATVAVTDCRQIDALADIVKKINNVSTSNTVASSDIQTMDGYTPSLFFDFGHYIYLKCTDQSLLSSFREQMDKTVVYKNNTPRYYSAGRKAVDIKHYSGLNTSEPSKNVLSANFTETAWYKATH